MKLHNPSPAQVSGRTIITRDEERGTETASLRHALGYLTPQTIPRGTQTHKKFSKVRTTQEMFFLPRSNPEESWLPTLFILKSSFIPCHHRFHPSTCGATASPRTPSLSPASCSPAVPAAPCAGTAVTTRRSLARVSHEAWNLSRHLCGVTSWVPKKAVSSGGGSVEVTANCAAWWREFTQAGSTRGQSFPCP